MITGQANNVTEVAQAQTVSVYPNPSNTGVLNVLVSTNATVELLDMNGKLVISQNVNANVKQEINVDNLANGVYTIRIQNNEFLSTSKVVINK